MFKLQSFSLIVSISTTDAYFSTSSNASKADTIFSISSSLSLFLFPSLTKSLLPSINKIFPFLSSAFALFKTSIAAGIPVP